MRIDRLFVSHFRNLRNFAVDFDESQFTSVLIGENGTGKSNLLEAIVLIFRNLDLEDTSTFAFEMLYTCRSRQIRVVGELGQRAIVTVVSEDPEAPLAATTFRARKDELLPKYVFAYYSGPSARMRSYFHQHEKRYYDTILGDDSGGSPPIRRLFFCVPEHSRWVLLAYFLRGATPPAFLRASFGIEAFDSALLVLKQPDWAKKWSAQRPPPRRIAEKGDDRFWWSRGVVKTFLQRVLDQSLAPIWAIEDHQEDYRARPAQEQRLYLYLPSLDSLQRLETEYQDEATLFAALESADISQLVRDVRIRVRRAGESIVFSEMSEGEQQLLTVVGLMQFTRHEESLFLLDEPDTHLNPAWKLSYLNELAVQAGLAARETDAGGESAWLDPTSQLLLTTHDPLTIAGLQRQQVQIFERSANATRVRHPADDPRGLGVAGVLIEMFGLPSTLDPVTQRLIDRRNELARTSDRTASEEEELSDVAAQLESLGLAYESRDADYRRYLKAMHKWEVEESLRLDELPLNEQERIVERILAQLAATSE